MYTHYPVYMRSDASPPRTTSATAPTMSTREHILSVAHRLFYGAGVRAVSLDTIAAEAGVTKRTIYYHFRSKEELVEAYMQANDEPTLQFIRQAYEGAQGTVAERIAQVFGAHAALACRPRWKGCGVLRTSVELIDAPGHPALKLGRSHKKRLEDWLAALFDEALGPDRARALAQEIVVIHDGALAVVLLHRDAAYFEVAGRAARTLIEHAWGHGAATDRRDERRLGPPGR